MTTQQARVVGDGTLDRLIERFLDHLAVERGVAPNTRNAYTRDLQLYRGWLRARGVSDPASISSEDVAAFISWMRIEEYAPGKRYAAATVARVLAAVRGLHRWMVRDGHCPIDPAAPLGTMKIPRSLPKALSLEEVEALITAVPAEGIPARRDRAMLELLYAAGLRISELTALDVDDVDLDETRTVRCIGKGSKERIVPIGRAAIDALKAYLTQERPAMATDGGEHALFVNRRGKRLTRQGCWKLLKMYAERAKLKRRISPHTLRHSFATHLVDGGAEVRVVQELLGHASVSTTQIYAEVSQDKLREIYVEAHPRAKLTQRGR